jgi:hypothetical protein
MDLFLLTGSDSARVLYASKENLDENQKDITFRDIFIFIFQIAVMYLAGSLSWNCSGKYPVYLRVLFAILAALFGTTYIFFYILFRSDLC